MKMAPDEIRRAACNGMSDPDLMSAVEYPLMVQQARLVCATCPLAIRRACLEEGLAIRDAFTIRGGTTPTQRAAFEPGYLRYLVDSPERFLRSSAARNPAKVMESAA